jgi:hypothetical protein
MNEVQAMEWQEVLEECFLFAIIETAKRKAYSRSFARP